MSLVCPGLFGISALGDKAGIATEPLGVYGYYKDTLTRMKFDSLPKQEGHRMEIRHFVQCIEKNLRVPMIIEAIYEASAKNKEIAIKA